MTRGKKKRGRIEPFLSRESDWLLVWNVDGVQAVNDGLFDVLCFQFLIFSFSLSLADRLTSFIIIWSSFLRGIARLVSPPPSC
jgi:hypothetical protein